MTDYIRCDGADIPPCLDCRIHPANNTGDPAKQRLIRPMVHDLRCADWLPKPPQPYESEVSKS